MEGGREEGGGRRRRSADDNEEERRRRNKPRQKNAWAKKQREKGKMGKSGKITNRGEEEALQIISKIYNKPKATSLLLDIRMIDMIFSSQV